MMAVLWCKIEINIYNKPKSDYLREEYFNELYKDKAASYSIKTKL